MNFQLVSVDPLNITILCWGIVKHTSYKSSKDLDIYGKIGIQFLTWGVL